MKIRFIALILCLLCASAEVFGQRQRRKTQSPVRPISLRQVGRYANQHTPGTLRLSHMVLSGFKHIENDWVYVFNLRDPRTGLQRGKDLTVNKHTFLICTDQAIGVPLLKDKDEWLAHRVNVYLIITDRGLTPNIYVGYVTKVELLDEKGEIVKTLRSAT